MNAQAQPPEAKPPSAFRVMLPYLGPVIGIIGISLAIYFHSQSVQERTPVYYVNPQRASIVDIAASSTSELEILHRGRKISAPSIVAATLYFWNDGRLPIRNSDILDPIEFALPAGVEILEARVVRVSRPVCKFQVTPREQNKLSLTFDILEKSDGAAIQLIYAGALDASIAPSGTVVGAGTPKLFSAKSTERLLRSRSQRTFLRLDRYISYVLFGMYSLMLIVTIVFRITGGGGTTRKYILPIVVVGFVFAGYSVYDNYKATSPGIPDTIWAK